MKSTSLLCRSGWLGALRVLAALPLLLWTVGCQEPPAEEPGSESAEAMSEEASPAPTEVMVVEDVGFMTPESVLHDAQSDIYLVSNINGAPLEEDGNGFISRLAPDGEVQELRWIDGEADDVTLNAPKGMAIVGGLLYVTDIDVVRVFDQATGEPVGEYPVEGASFLNDLTTGTDGTVYVSDTGVGADFSPTGTAAVYALRDGAWEALATGEALANPNGLLAVDNAVLMVPFGGSSVFRLPTDGGEPSVQAELPAGQLDGVVRSADGALLVSSWEGQAVYRVSTDGSVETVVDGVEAPADIGWDAQRNRLLVPLFMGDAVQIHPMGG